MRPRRARAPPFDPGAGRPSPSALPPHCGARRSVSRTDQPAATASRASRRRTSLPFAIRIARPWPSLSSPSDEQLQHVVGQVEQPDQVRDRRAGASEAAGELLLREPELLDQRRAGARLVDRVEVLAGDVLDQRRLHPPRGVLVADHRRHRLRAQPRARRASGARRRSARSGRPAAGGGSAAGSRRPRRPTRRARRAPRGRSCGAAARDSAESGRPGPRGSGVAGTRLGQDRGEAAPDPRRLLTPPPPAPTRGPRARLPAVGRRPLRGSRGRG